MTSKTTVPSGSMLASSATPRCRTIMGPEKTAPRKRMLAPDTTDVHGGMLTYHTKVPCAKMRQIPKAVEGFSMRPTVSSGTFRAHSATARLVLSARRVYHTEVVRVVN